MADLKALYAGLVWNPQRRKQLWHHIDQDAQGQDAPDQVCLRMIAADRGRNCVSGSFQRLGKEGLGRAVSALELQGVRVASVEDAVQSLWLCALRVTHPGPCPQVCRVQMPGSRTTGLR